MTSIGRKIASLMGGLGDHKLASHLHCNRCLNIDDRVGGPQNMLLMLLLMLLAGRQEDHLLQNFL